MYSLHCVSAEFVFRRCVHVTLLLISNFAAISRCFLTRSCSKRSQMQTMSDVSSKCPLHFSFINPTNANYRLGSDHGPFRLHDRFIDIFDHMLTISLYNVAVPDHVLDAVRENENLALFELNHCQVTERVCQVINDHPRLEELSCVSLCFPAPLCSNLFRSGFVGFPTTLCMPF